MWDRRMRCCFSRFVLVFHLTLALSQSEMEIRTLCTDNVFALCNNLSGRLSLEFIQRSEINSARLFETKRESTYA